MLNPQANPILLKTEEAIRAKVKPEQKNAFERIITAGLKVMDGEQSHKLIVNQLKADADPADIAGTGVAKLIGLLMAQSKGSMPMPAGMPAAAVLLCESLDRLEALGKVEVTNEVVAQAMHSFSSAFLQAIGVTPEKLNKMMAERQQGQQQPAEPAQPAAQPAQPLIGEQP